MWQRKHRLWDYSATGCTWPQLFAHFIDNFGISVRVLFGTLVIFPLQIAPTLLIRFCLSNFSQYVPTLNRRQSIVNFRLGKQIEVFLPTRETLDFIVDQTRFCGVRGSPFIETVLLVSLHLCLTSIRACEMCEFDFIPICDRCSFGGNITCCFNFSSYSPSIKPWPVFFGVVSRIFKGQHEYLEEDIFVHHQWTWLQAWLNWYYWNLFVCVCVNTDWLPIR